MNACNAFIGCLLATLAAGQGVAAESAPATTLVRLGSEQMRLSGIRTQPVGTTGQPDAGDAAGGSGVRLSGEAVVPDLSIEVVMATVEGQVQSVLVGPGQAIAAGQPVARLYSQGAIGLQRAWLQARARADVAATAARRAEELFAAGIIAESRVQAARAELSDAQAARAEQRQLLRLAGMGDGTIDALRGAEGITPVLTIVARASGTVLERLQGAGQTVAAGTPLLRVASGPDLWLELRAARVQAAQLRVGDTVSVPGCAARGRLVAVGGGVDASSQTVGVRALLSGGRSCLQPGQYLEATVLARVAPGLVSVPQSALVSAGGTDYVFVREAAGFRPVAVKVAVRRGSEAWLERGPAVGAQVASAGLTALKGAWNGFGTPLPGTGG
jgi:multidrug efflux pump subunit AcrA (membrane-fusion protein)